MQKEYYAIYGSGIANFLRRALPLQEVYRWYKLIRQENEYGSLASLGPDGRLCFEPEWAGEARSVGMPFMAATSLHSHPRILDDIYVGPSRADICASFQRGECWQLIAARPGVFAHRFFVTFEVTAFTTSAYGRRNPDWYAALQEACELLDTPEAVVQRRALRRLKRVVWARYPGLEVDFVSWHDLFRSCTA
jgi:hypothetical protein